MVRTKAVAVLLGPSGVGLVGLYVSITGLVSTIAQLGIDQSGVREVAQSHGTGDPEQVARVVKTLRRVCLLTGILGWILTIALAWPLSQWTFGSPERIWTIAILGVTVLIGAIAGGQTALLQGMRRIGDLARIQVLSAVLTTIIAIGLYAWLGEKGIVPVIILTAVIHLGFSWYYSRRIQILFVPQSWAETAATSKRLVGLGAAFLFVAVVTAAASLAIRALIINNLGINASGIYQAAWALSGIFGGFIISAMGTDFYPRLTAVSNDHAAATKLVNEQIEIGAILALPGVLVSLAIASYLMHALYSAEFSVGSDMLPWFLVSVFLRMITYPMGYILVAKAAGQQYALLTTLFHVTHVTLIALILPFMQLKGVAIANTLLCVIYLFSMRLAVGSQIEFRWSMQTKKLIAACSFFVVSSFLIFQIFSSGVALALGGSLTALSCVFCLRALVARLGREHRLIQLTCRLPFGRKMCGF